MLEQKGYKHAEHSCVNMKEVVWKEIPSTNGRYEASNDGQIRRIQTGKILKPSKDHKGGYLQVRLLVGRFLNADIQFRAHVHRLVALTFLGGKPSPQWQVNHKNGIKTDNRVENLEYVTPAVNVNHAIMNGLIRRSLSIHQIEEVERMRNETGFGSIRISKHLGYPVNAVEYVIRKMKKRNQNEPRN